MWSAELPSAVMPSRHVQRLSSAIVVVGRICAKRSASPVETALSNWGFIVCGLCNDAMFVCVLLKLGSGHSQVHVHSEG